MPTHTARRAPPSASRDPHRSSQTGDKVSQYAAVQTNPIPVKARIIVAIALAVRTHLDANRQLADRLL